jgi:hypothetical protein
VELPDDKALVLDIALHGVSYRIVHLGQKPRLKNNLPAPAPGAPPRSHGFGGDTEAILPAPLLSGYSVARQALTVVVLGVQAGVVMAETSDVNEATGRCGG